MATIEVGEFLQVQKPDLRVDDNEEVDLDPEKQQFQQLFHRVRISTFDDLQQLEMIPRQLRKEDALRAIAEDDQAALELSSRVAAGTSRGCDCSGMHQAEVGIVGYRDLRQSYSRIRSTYNPSLAKLLTEATGAPTRWRDLDVSLFHKRIQESLRSSLGMAMWLARLGDFVIGKNSTVNLAASAKGLYGNGLRIHLGGKLIIKGSGVKLRFLSAQGDLP